VNTPKRGADAGAAINHPPSRLRLPLAAIEDVRRELARVYREAKSGRRDVQDASRLAHILSVLARLIEGADLERRIATLEAAAAATAKSQGRQWNGAGATATPPARTAQ
jgi:hypothetical protein